MLQECIKAQITKTNPKKLHQAPPPIESFILPAIKKIQSQEIAVGMVMLQKVLDQRPNNYAALSWCGMGAFMQGNAPLAINYFEAALKINTDDAQLLSNLGQSYMGIGATDKAYDVFSKAYALNNQDAEASYYLGFLSEQKSDTQQAELLYRNAIKYNPNLYHSYVQLANICHQQGSNAEAFMLLRAARQLHPNLKDLQFIMGQFVAKSVPGWHLPMLADNDRNKAYEQAINSRVTADDIVLDIGTGSGLLAMMAARAGAKHVYACEADPILAQLAQEIIEKNGYADKITLIQKHSSEIIMGQDMPIKANMLVTEIFDRALVGEGALQTITHAKAHLLTSDAKIIPQTATLYGTLMQAPHLQKFYQANDVCGFDLSSMSDIAHPLKYQDAQIERAENVYDLCQPFTLHSFNFEGDFNQNFQSVNNIQITKSGIADSVVMHFTLGLAPGITFSTENVCAKHHWRQATQILPQSIQCDNKQKVSLKTNYTSYFDFYI